MSNMVLHEFCHEAIDASSCRRQPLKHVRAWDILIERPQHGFELAYYFLCAVDEIQFFPGKM